MSVLQFFIYLFVLFVGFLLGLAYSSFFSKKEKAGRAKTPYGKHKDDEASDEPDDDN